MDVEIKNFGFKPLIVKSVSGFLFLHHPLSTVSATEHITVWSLSVDLVPQLIMCTNAHTQM